MFFQKPWWVFWHPLFALVLVLVLFAANAGGQGIDVRTYPLLASASFFTYPGSRDGMGGVAIALDDALQDIFINPAKARRLHGKFFFSAPNLHGWSFEQNSTLMYPGNTMVPVYSYYNKEQANASVFSLPLGFIDADHGTTFGLVGNVQRLAWKTSRSQGSTSPTASLTRDRQSAFNLPFSFLFAVGLPGTKWALGASVNVVDVQGIDGLNMLYPGSEKIDVDGTAFDVRTGLTGAFSDRDELSLLVGRQAYHVEHDARYEPITHVENVDENDGWFAQLEYRRWLTENFRLGLQTTGDWKEYPKIPNYPLSGIPRDPGTTKAYDLGLGLCWQTPTSRFAVDAIYEPITTKTWVEAENDIVIEETETTRRFPKGTTILRNDYTFSNWVVRVGAETEVADWLRLRVGSQVKSVKYDYFFQDVIWRSERSVSPQNKWTEVTLTGGATLHWGNFEWLLTSRIQTGNGLLRTSWPLWWAVDDGVIVGARADYLIPPSDWVNVRPVPVFTNQVTLVYRWH